MKLKDSGKISTFIAAVVLNLTKIKTKEHNNRQAINICIRNGDTNKEK